MLPMMINMKIPRRLLVMCLGALLLAGWPFFGGLAPLASEGLQWEHQDDNFWNFRTHDRRFWHKDAERYCQQLTEDGHYDWRLPTL